MVDEHEFSLVPACGGGGASCPLVAAIEAQGFAVLEDFLPRSLVEELIRRVEELPAESEVSRLRRGVVFARRSLLALPFVRELVELPLVRGAVDAVARGAIPVRAILFDKTESVNWTVPWHQDRSIAVREKIETPGFGPWSCKAGVIHVQPPEDVLRKMLTLRFHLDACGKENGPLRVIPNTHRRILSPGELEGVVAAEPQVACTTDAGGLVMMRPLILHASSPATATGAEWGACSPNLPSPLRARASEPRAGVPGEGKRGATAARHRRVIHIEFGPPELPGGLRWAW